MVIIGYQQFNFNRGDNFACKGDNFTCKSDNFACKGDNFACKGDNLIYFILITELLAGFRVLIYVNRQDNFASRGDN